MNGDDNADDNGDDNENSRKTETDISEQSGNANIDKLDR